jgi:hypothetical protein
MRSFAYGADAAYRQMLAAILVYVCDTALARQSRFTDLYGERGRYMASGVRVHLRRLHVYLVDLVDCRRSQ